MNPNPKIIFNPTKMLISEIFIVGFTIFIFIGAFCVFLMIVALFGGITLFNFILTTLITLILFSLIVLFMYHENIILKQPIAFFRYKKVFSEHPISLVSDFVEVTNGKYGYQDDVISQLDDFIVQKRITGCKLRVLDGKWTFVCPRTEEPLIPQQPIVDKEFIATEIDESSPSSQRNSRTTSSTSSISNEIARLSIYSNHGIITEDEFQNAKTKLFDSEQKGYVPSLSDEVASLNSFRNNGTITEVEFQNAKAKLFEL